MCSMSERFSSLLKMEEKRSNLGTFLIILALCLSVLHATAIRAQRIMQARHCYALRDENLTAYMNCKENITYFSALFNVKELIHALE